MIAATDEDEEFDFADANRILRRGFSYSRGFDGAGRLDQGLLFGSFQAGLEAGFLAVQERLAGEPLEESIQPEGGGFFYGDGRRQESCTCDGRPPQHATGREEPDDEWQQSVPRD